MNHKEYIIPIGEEAKEFDEIFIGVIRKQPELIRCKDCVFNHGGECWGFGDGHLVCDDDYCSGGERKEE